MEVGKILFILLQRIDNEPLIIFKLLTCHGGAIDNIVFFFQLSSRAAEVANQAKQNYDKNWNSEH